MWLVIEGDNGVGKDTVRALLERAGWLHINALPRPRAALAHARRHRSVARIKPYLEFCRVCAVEAARCARACVVVRYWPSTLAGALADELIDRNAFDTLLERCLATFPQPDAVAELRCAHEERVRRILHRSRAASSRGDSLDPARAARHRWALERIAACWGVPWRVMDTTRRCPEELVDELQGWLRSLERTGRCKHL